MATSSPIIELTERISRDESLRRPAMWITELGGRRMRRISRRLEDWLGHAGHPPLTDLPVGFWTSACVVDLVGGRSGATTARRLVGLGVLSAIPTAMTGLGDAASMSEERRRVAAVHATCNAVATMVYAASWLARHKGHRPMGLLLGMAGAALATAGGALGGHLAFGESSESAGLDLSVDLSEQLIEVELGRRSAGDATEL